MAFHIAIAILIEPFELALKGVKIRGVKRAYASAV
jgi:hypothetical protein